MVNGHRGVVTGLTLGPLLKWRALACYVWCISYTDAPICPTQREVAGLCLPVFDNEVDPDVTRRLAESECPGEALQTGKVEPVGGAKSTVPFLLGEGLPPIPAKLVQKGDFVDMAELLQDNIESDRRRSKVVLPQDNSPRVGVRFQTF